MNIANFLQRSGRMYRDSYALALGSRGSATYGQLSSRAAKLAGTLLQKFNLTAGDRVAIIAKNVPEYLEIIYGCWHAGLIIVPINAKLHVNEYAFILKDSGARLCFLSEDLSFSFKSIDGSKLEKVFKLGTPTYDELFDYKEVQIASCDSDTIAWIFYTSGTTGQPKGAALTHRNLLAMCHCYFTDVDCEGVSEAILHVAPMSHGSGLYSLAHVMRGTVNVFPESGGFDVREVFNLISSWPNVVFFAAPTMIKRLVESEIRADTANLKTIIYGGGPMYLDDLKAGLKRFGAKFSQLYGQGETPMTITAMNERIHAANTHPRWESRMMSVGTPQSAVEVKVVGRSGAELEVGETGEIIVRGDTVMSGYWNNDLASKKSLRDGWLYTGDNGFFDEDGFLTLQGRSNDLIISGGSNIYPRELEELLLTHADISEVSVIGKPDPEWGETVVAYLVLVPGVELDTAGLDQFCIDNIARFKRPKHYRAVTELPKNNYGKVLKTCLREIETKRNDAS
jgi:long-chain acyl-CoA synthetase